MLSADAMRRALLICLGVSLGLVAVVILWNTADLYDHDDTWLPVALTRAAGLGVVALGILAAFWAAVSIGRALRPVRTATSASDVTHTDFAPTHTGGGPVLPIMGLL